MSNQNGIRAYYHNKIEALEQQILEKSQNLKRLEAQRNELNNSGKFIRKRIFYDLSKKSDYSEKKSQHYTSQALM